MGDWDFLYEMNDRGYSPEEIADAAGSGAAPWEWEYITKEWLDSQFEGETEEDAHSVEPKFARHLREQGIDANATERAVRGAGRAHKLDGIYRAVRRGSSTHMRERVEAVAYDLREGTLRIESGKSELVRTRERVARGWDAARDILIKTGRPELATQVDRFVEQMRPPQTENEFIAELLRQRARAR